MVLVNIWKTCKELKWYKTKDNSFYWGDLLSNKILYMNAKTNDVGEIYSMHPAMFSWLAASE